MPFQTLTYKTDGRIATITLNRPERLNAIASGMPSEIRQAVEKANEDNQVHVIILTGAGRSFCAGYDLIDFAEKPGGNEAIATEDDPKVQSCVQPVLSTQFGL